MLVQHWSTMPRFCRGPSRARVCGLLVPGPSSSSSSTSSAARGRDGDAAQARERPRGPPPAPHGPGGAGARPPGRCHRGAPNRGPWACPPLLTPCSPPQPPGLRPVPQVCGQEAGSPSERGRSAPGSEAAASGRDRSRRGEKVAGTSPPPRRYRGSPQGARAEPGTGPPGKCPPRPPPGSRQRAAAHPAGPPPRGGPWASRRSHVPRTPRTAPPPGGSRTGAG